jgi:hypothetical protein
LKDKQIKQHQEAIVLLKQQIVEAFEKGFEKGTKKVEGSSFVETETLESESGKLKPKGSNAESKVKILEDQLKQRESKWIEDQQKER